MAKFQFTASMDDLDRDYVLVDDFFDVHLLRTREQLIIDVYGKDESELLGTLAINNPSIREE